MYITIQKTLYIALLADVMNEFLTAYSSRQTRNIRKTSQKIVVPFASEPLKANWNPIYCRFRMKLNTKKFVSNN